MYRYSLTQRPPMPGAFPRFAEVVEDFGGKVFCEDIGHEAWGYVEYEKPLTREEMVSYELARLVCTVRMEAKK